MPFDVRRSDVDAVGAWIAAYASQVGEQLSMVASAARGVASLESFQGRAADGVKAYWGEMHVAAATALAAALSELAMRYAAYMDGYGDIDSARDARFEDSALEAASSSLSSCRLDLAGKARELRLAVESVSDLVGGWAPPTGPLDSSLVDLVDEARDLGRRVEAHEARHAAAASSCGALVAASRSLVLSLGSGGASSYVPGSASSMPWAAGLASALAASASYRQGAAEGYRSSIEGLLLRERERHDERISLLARQREEQGRAQFWTSVIAMSCGALALVFSCGAATPVVAGLFVAAGAFQASNLVEGVQNARYGKDGDVSSHAFNPLRDTVFLGNEEAYGAAEFAVTAAAGAAIPAAAAAGAARATGAPFTKVALRTAGSFGAAVVKDQAVDLGVTVAVDPIIRRTLGDGASGQIASEIAHQGVGLVVGGISPETPPGSPANPFRVEGLDLPERFFAGPAGARVGGSQTEP